MNLRHNEKNICLRLADALLAALLATMAAAFGFLDDFDRRVSDKFYQTPQKRSSDIVVIGIDAETLDKLGRLSAWSRRGMTQAIEILNSDPKTRPAVIGVDMIFSGASNGKDAAEDQNLAAAAGAHGNVVIASRAAYRSHPQTKEDKNDPYYPWDKTWPWDISYKLLAEKTATGHINAPDEPDKIVRHALLYVNVAGKDEPLYSFGRVVYEMWCRAGNRHPNAPPSTEGNGLYYLPFTADGYSRGFNFVDLIEHKISPDEYGGKIVLIGPYDTGLGDVATTALNHADDMYGVDIHANTVEAFQRGFFPREAGEKSQLTLLFLVALAAEAWFRRGGMRQIVVGWLAICFGWIAVCKLCYANEIILHVTWIPITISVIFVGAVMTQNYLRVEEERVRFTVIFGRYFDPTVLQKLLKGDSDAFKLGGNLREVAVLFVDIRGFTPMSAKLSPPDIADVLNMYLALITACIRRHHGTLDKFIGDAAMAFWNAPEAQKDSVLLACQAAMDMLAGLDDLRAKVNSRYGVDISFGIGIHWGSAVVGNIGTEERMDYTAIGDTVNTAARLESNAGRGEIFVSRAVAEKLGDRARVTSLGTSIKLKGKSGDFEVFKLEGLT